MKRKRKKLSNNKNSIKKKKIIRCRSKMIPVFEDENCEIFLKKEQTETNNICKNCKHSF
jgi:hypothetical protein